MHITRIHALHIYRKEIDRIEKNREKEERDIRKEIKTEGRKIVQFLFMIIRECIYHTYRLACCVFKCQI